MYEIQKQEVLETALEIKKCGLVSLSGGNVSLRVEKDAYLVTPSGMVYENMKPDDVCLINGQCEVLEGVRKPSSDAAALLYMFAHMPGVHAIIHTHQPWATAVGFVADVLPEFMVTVMDACKGPVPVAPFTPSSDIGMGMVAVEYAGDSLAVILKHHGVVAYGADLQEALFSAIYLEEAAKTFVLAKSMRAHIPPLDPELIAKEKESWKRYGQ